jgi:hypothetical protein
VRRHRTARVGASERREVIPRLDGVLLHELLERLPHLLGVVREAAGREHLLGAP